MGTRSFLLAVVLALVAACGTFGGNTKVDKGQLYQSGDSNYDPFFQQVHQQQVLAQAWPDEKKAARRPLATALAASPAAADETLVHETRKRAKAGAIDGALANAVDETKRAETERATKLKTHAAKLDQLTKEGKELQAEAKKEYDGRGAERADEKKEERRRELNHELDAAVDNLGSLAKLAKSHAKDAEEFVVNLSVASGREGTPAPVEKPAEPAAEKKPEPAAPPPAAKPAAKPRPKDKPSAKPAEKPAEKPDKPAEKPPEKPAKPPDEVFNP